MLITEGSVITVDKIINVYSTFTYDVVCPISLESVDVSQSFEKEKGDFFLKHNVYKLINVQRRLSCTVLKPLLCEDLRSCCRSFSTDQIQIVKQ